MNPSLIQNQRRRTRGALFAAAAMIASLVLARTLAQGGPIPKYAADPTTSTTTNQAPTYLGDVRPILMAHCARCHNQQDRFIYDWLNYKTAYANRWEIRRRVWNSWQGTFYKESMPVANSPEALDMSEEDRMAIREWVDHGAPRGVAPPPVIANTKAERVDLGRHLFVTVCAACHQPSGQGLPNVFPPLAGSDFLNADKDRAIQTVIFGRRGEVVVNGLRFNNTMPSLPLSDEDIANVLTYVYNSFGNSGLEVTPQEVEAVRAKGPAPEPSHPTAPSAPAAKNAFE